MQTDPDRAFSLPSLSLHAIALTSILATATALRFYGLDHTSLWLDEAASWRQANQPFLDMIAATAADNYPPLHNIVLHFTIRMFGDSEIALRAPSAIMGVATVYLVYRLGTLVWDRTTGLVAALFLSLSGFHIWYSIEARMYALLAFTAALFALTAMRAAQRPSRSRLTACVCAGILLLYSHVYGSFAFVAVNLVILGTAMTRADQIAVSWRRWIGAQAVAAVTFLPWALILLRRAIKGIGSIDWIPEPTGYFLVHQFSTLFSGVIPFVLFMILYLSSIIFLVFSKKYYFKNFIYNINWRIWVVVTSAFLPVLIGYALSIVYQPILIRRYLICMLPFLLLLAARGLVLIAHHRSVLVIAAIGLAYASFPGFPKAAEPSWRPDHKGAMTAFSTRYQPGDRVAFFGWDSSTPAVYYFREPLEYEVWRSGVRAALAEDSSRRIWLFTLHIRSQKKIENIHARFSDAGFDKSYSYRSRRLFVFLFERED